MRAPWDWDGLALAIDLLNAAISQEVRVGDARVAIIDRDSARLVRDAAEAWQRDYADPGRVGLTKVLAWLDEAPEDWPFTGADIAAMIRAGCPDWHSPGGGAPHRDAREVVEWLESRSWGSDVADTNARHYAEAIRANFNMPKRQPEAMAHWARMGLKSGDICNREGDLLDLNGQPFGQGHFWLTKDQAARAAVFGWMLEEGLLPSAHAPDLVAVKR